MYIGGVRGLMAHRGYGMVASDGWFGPLVTYMPAFPALIAIVGSTGIDLLVAARWIAIGLFAINVGLLAIVIWFNTNRSTPVALLGTAVFCASPVALGLHAYALSEPLFIACLLGAIGLLSSVLKGPRIWKIVCCGAVLGLAYLTRYAGLAFMGSAVLITLSVLPGSWKRCASYTAALAAMCALAVVPWMIRNHHIGIASIGRPAAWHPMNVTHLRSGGQTVCEWFVPASVPWQRLAWAAYAAALIAGAVTLLKMRRPIAVDAPKFLSQPEAVVVPCMAVVYMLFLIISISVFDAGIPLDARILSPLFVMALLGTCLLLGNTSQNAWRLATLPLLCVLLLVSACGQISNVRSMRDDGLGYASASWKNSPTIHALDQYPPDVIVYSNGWDVVYLYTSRHTELLPNKPDENTDSSRASYEAKIQRLDDELKARRAVVVYLRHSRRGATFLSEDELTKQLSVRRAARYDDGAIYVWQRSR